MELMLRKIGSTPEFVEMVYGAGDANEMAVRIYVGIRKADAIACPICGVETKRYGYEKNERICRHGDCLFYTNH